MENMYLFFIAFLLSFSVFAKNTLAIKDSGDEDPSLAEKKRTEAWKKIRKVTSMKDFLESFPLEKSLAFRIVETMKSNGKIVKTYVFDRKTTSGGVTYGLEGRVQDKTFSLPKGIPCIPHPRPFHTNTITLPRDSRLLMGIIYPPCVAYNQCGGCCVDKMVCVPIKLNVLQINLLGLTSSAVPKAISFTHNLTEHAECGCQCKVQSKDCIGDQTYNPDMCECECKEGAKRPCGTNQQWSPSSCDCVCSEVNPQCTTDEIWNNKKCMCQCNISKSCPAGKTRDINHCNCI